MKPKFNINEFEKLKNDEIVFECENCGHDFKSTKKYIRRALGITKHKRKTTLNYCSRKCSSETRKLGKDVKCLNCEKEIYRSLKELKKNDNEIFFCSYECKGTHWNKNKNFGTNRSKLEKWIEEELLKKYQFEINFNVRNILNSGYELDIFIPEIKTAFELNGIFHYEPIFGDQVLKLTKTKDVIKINECEKNGIELIVIDTSDSKSFDKIKDKRYLDFIIREIDMKIKK